MKSQKITLTRAAIYLRLSKEDIDKEGESASIENQRKIIQKFAKEHSLSIYREYSDDGISGTTFERPAFRQLIMDIEKNEIDLIIIKDLSRLGRDYIQVGNYLENIFPLYRVRCIAINDNYDSADKNANDFIPFKNVLNEFYAADISRKIRATFKAKYDAGEFIGNFAPYGYQKNPSDKNHLIVDAQVSPIVKTIFKKAANGVNPAEIARQLNEENVPSPIVYRCLIHQYLNVDSFSKHKLWTSGTIQKLLKNTVYLGHMAQGKTERISHKNKTTLIKNRDEWVVKENTHEALTEEETFRIACQRMQGRASKLATGFTNIFSGLAKCADCGKNMSTVKTRKKDSLYNLACGGYKWGGIKQCTNHFIDYTILYSIVFNAIKEQIKLTEQDTRELLKELQDSNNKSNKQTKSDEIQRLRTEEVKLNQFINKVYEDYYAEKINEDVKNRLIKQYGSKLTISSHRLKSLESMAIQSVREEETHKKLIDMIKKYTDIQALDSDTLFTLIDRIEVHQGHFETVNGRRVKQQTVKICFKFLSNAKTSHYTV